MIAVDQNIPLPPRNLGLLPGKAKHWAPKYPWRKMQPGDSFVIPSQPDVWHAQRKASNLIASRHKIGRERYTMRTITESGARVIRIWRVA